MKNIIPLLLAFIFFTEIQAQNTFGINVAYNKTSTNKPGDFADIAGINRFQLGVFGKLSVYKNFFVKGSLLYNQKGNIYDDDNYIADAGKRVSIKLNYMEAAVDLGYSIRLIGKHRVLVGAGPYLAYGLNGTEKGIGETIMGPLVIDRKVEFTNADYSDGKKLLVKPIDVGLNFNIGYQYRKYGAFFNYGLGLTNRQNAELSYTYKTYNRVASVGVSYSFK